MNIDQAGLDFIKDNEGFRSQIYLDSAGRQTIGIGHLVLPTDNFPESGITEAEAEAILAKDVEHVVIFLNAVNLNLSQNRFNCLCDFGFNLGTGALHEMLQHGLDEVPTQILRWDHAAGKVIEGLLERRQRELNLWNQ